MIFTFGVLESHANAVKFTPAINVKFSVYVPGIMKIVSPLEDDANALVIVVCVPKPAVGFTIHFATPNLLSAVLIGMLCYPVKACC